MKDRRILIAGCGYVGGRLAELLVRRGADVHALRRSAGAAPPGATAVRADLADPAGLERLPHPLHGVVFAAGPSSPDEAGYRSLFVDGLQNLLAALSARTPRPDRLIFTSSTAVYGQSDGEWVDESSPTEPTRWNGRVLLEAESLLRESPIPCCALRLGGIYGPGRTGRIRQVREGRAQLAPGEPHYTNRIHRDDAAGAILHLLSVSRLDPVYLGVDDDPAADNDVLRFLAAQLGVPEPTTAESAPPRRSGSKRCRNDRLRATGYRFVHPSYRDGYQALIREEPRRL